jgi:hypothetical protein
VSVDEKVKDGAERRFVVPEIAIWYFPVEDVNGRGQMIVFIGPKKMDVAKTKAGESEDQDADHRARQNRLARGNYAVHSRVS